MIDAIWTKKIGWTNLLCMMKNVVGVLLKYFAGFFPQSMEKASFSEQKLQLCKAIINTITS